MASSRSGSTASSITATKGAARKTLPQPKDLSHLFSVVARNRESSEIKAFYKFMQIPGISNFAGGESIQASAADAF
jgi:hypothetical protein